MMWGAPILPPCGVPTTPTTASVCPTTAARNFALSSSTTFSSYSAGAGSFDFPLASRIIVRNIPYTTTETSIRKKFSSFGQVAEVTLPKEGNGEKSRGYAFVQYTSQDDALLALENMDHQLIDGRIVRVEIAKMVNYARQRDYPRTSGPPKRQNS